MNEIGFVSEWYRSLRPHGTANIIVLTRLLPNGTAFDAEILALTSPTLIRFPSEANDKILGQNSSYKKAVIN